MNTLDLLADDPPNTIHLKYTGDRAECGHCDRARDMGVDPSDRG